MKTDEKMKKLESSFDQNLVEGAIVGIRCDGRAFHTYTAGLKRPYDSSLHSLMVETTKKLVTECNAVIGYTQSDEISLIVVPNPEVLFSGRVNKINSIMASVATGFFRDNVSKYLPSKVGLEPQFDCRCFNFPDKESVYEYLRWREWDASKNSVSSAAQSKFKQKELHGLNTKQQQEKLFTEAGINWNDYPSWCKRGSFIKPLLVKHRFTKEEIEKLPPQHLAIKNPEMCFIRRKIDRVETPKFSTIINQEEFVFGQELPLTQDSTMV